MDALTILLAPAILITLMILSHTYLGLHVLERGIIFVDLAVAQVAALGMSVAFLLGMDAHGLTAQLLALLSTFVAAFGLTKEKGLLLHEQSHLFLFRKSVQG